MAKNRQLNFNRSAPDLTLLNTAGKPVQLSSLWAQQPLLLAFTRHFGCTQCKEMLDELVSGRERIEKAGLDIAVITQGTPEATALFAQQYAPGLLCLSDPQSAKPMKPMVWNAAIYFRPSLTPKYGRQYPGRARKATRSNLRPPGRTPCRCLEPLSSAGRGGSSCRITTITLPTTRRWICC